MSTGDLILYQTEDGLTQVNLRAIEGTVWLTQAELADLFATTRQNISLHLKNIFEDKELPETSVVKESLTTAVNDKRSSMKKFKPETDATCKNFLQVHKEFGNRWKKVEALSADEEDIKALEDLARKLEKKKGADDESS